MTMTDRELLERAAKAAGELTPSWYGNAAYFDGVLQRWNPLIDDGDALRLAVKIDLFGDPIFHHYRSLERFGNQEQDDLSATRRAIVRAAAAMAKEG